MPFIILSSTTSCTPYIVRSPSPWDKDDLANHQVRFQLGHHSRPVTPRGVTSNCFGDTWVPTAAPTTLFDPGDLWDNLLIPYSTYFPTGTGSPDHRTPPPVDNRYSSDNYWDQPIQNQELPLEPIPGIEEPIARPSSPCRSVWQDVDEQHLAPSQADPSLNQFGESVKFRRWPSETSISNTATELLPEAE